MYLFRVFRSFLPLHNPIGFGASDFVIFAVAALLVVLLLGAAYVKPYARALSQRTGLCMGVLFYLVIGLRLALLPQSPTPIASGADDFSYLLLGDTLAHFRLANTTHPLHQFFEAVFILQEPAYASIYPLGQGLFLAVGQLLMHSAWAGVLISCGAFCALCYWMLRAWVPAVWSLVGGLLAVIEFGPLNSWTNSYWGGFVSALAGCLVFGALPRMRGSQRVRYGLLLGGGLGLQILTRPFEAVFLTTAAGIYLLIGFRGRLAPILGAAGMIAGALLLTVLQNKAVTHSWTTMPYVESRYDYGVPATFTFQPNAVPHRAMTAEQELDYKAQAAIHGPGTDSVSDYFSRLFYRFRFLPFFLLPPLYFVIVPFLPRLREWRYLWLVGTCVLFALGTNVYAYFYPQYAAALTCVFVLISVEGLRRSGTMPRNFVALACGMAFLFWFGIYASGDRDLLATTDYQSWHYINRGDPQGREAIGEKLAKAPGRQLVFVRYSAAHRFEEWIHNNADIDAAQTVWANDQGTEENGKLLHYYPQRTVWLLEPDARPPALTPYGAETAPVFETVH